MAQLNPSEPATTGTCTALLCLNQGQNGQVCKTEQASSQAGIWKGQKDGFRCGYFVVPSVKNV